jgi:hypothetical protein
MQSAWLGSDPRIFRPADRVESTYRYLTPGAAGASHLAIRSWWEAPLMSVAYRVRYSLTPSRFPRAPADVRSADVTGGLDAVPGQLPAGAYILYIEDLAAGRDVHWTRWPMAYRPGFGGTDAPRPPAGPG